MTWGVGSFFKEKNRENIWWLFFFTLTKVIFLPLARAFVCIATQASHLLPPHLSKHCVNILSVRGSIHNSMIIEALLDLSRKVVSFWGGRGRKRKLGKKSLVRHQRAERKTSSSSLSLTAHSCFASSGNSTQKCAQHLRQDVLKAKVSYFDTFCSISACV